MFVGGGNTLTNKEEDIANDTFYIGLTSTAKKECGHSRKLVVVLMDKFAKYPHWELK